jgi:hypothetical protein
LSFVAVHHVLLFLFSLSGPLLLLTTWENLLIKCGLISTHKLKGQNLIKENSEQYITRQMDPNEIGTSLEKNT